MIEVFATKEELEKALAQLQKLEERGFGASLVSFRLAETGRMCSDDKIKYNGQFILKANPDDSRKNWGRISEQMIDWYSYENGELLDD